MSQVTSGKNAVVGSWGVTRSGVVAGVGRLFDLWGVSHDSHLPAVRTSEPLYSFSELNAAADMVHSMLADLLSSPDSSGLEGHVLKTGRAGTSDLG